MSDMMTTPGGDMVPNEVMIFTQWTPNPNAFKFIVSEFVIANGKASFQDMDEASHIPLAANLLAIDSVTQVHFYENVITVTQDGSRDWGELSETVEQAIKIYLPTHNINFERKKAKSREGLSPELMQIEEILDRTIRPGLQADGGDVEVVDFKDNILSIRYEGACGTCPSSLAGTLQAITSYLRDEYDPEIDVVTV